MMINIFKVAVLHKTPIAGINDGVVPLNILDSEDPTIIREHEQRERSLLYVAITRAKRFCAVSGFGKFSSFIQW